jgi:hypothetical protein
MLGHIGEKSDQDQRCIDFKGEESQVCQKLPYQPSESPDGSGEQKTKRQRFVVQDKLNELGYAAFPLASWRTNQDCLEHRSPPVLTEWAGYLAGHETEMLPL